MFSSLEMEHLQRARDIISTSLGIHFPADRLAELDKRLKEFAHSLKFKSHHDFINTLIAGRLGTEQACALVEILTVGETYFFRESATIEAVCKIIMPELAKQRGRSLRIWCAGCATGEEPYSIAMYLAEQPDLSDWGVSLIATDINSTFLERARKAEYSKWSFRSLPPYYRDHYFSKVDDNCYQIKGSISRKVKFSRLNLAEPAYPSPANGTEGLDVIFCRNVLMYFAPDTIKAIIERFAKALAPNGYLIVSQTECSDYFSKAFDTQEFRGSFFYRKKDASAQNISIFVTKTKIGQPGTPKTDKKTVRAGDTRLDQAVRTKIVEVREKKTGHTSRQSSSGDGLFDQAEKLANQGQLAEACVLCEEGIKHDSLNPHGHYLHALILQGTGRLPEAAGALRKVLYLEPDFVMANYALGTVEQRLGNVEQTWRCFDNTAKLLNLYRDEDILPWSEGVSAGHMRELLNMMRKRSTSPLP